MLFQGFNSKHLRRFLGLIWCVFFKTELGRIFTRFYISFSGFEAFVQELHNVPDDGLSTERLLHIIVQCPDFSGVQVRSNERALLRQLNSRVRYKVAAKPGQWKNKEKIFLLLQSNLDGIEITVSSRNALT